MKRRRFIKTIASASALPAALAAQGPAAATALELASFDEAADPLPSFFTANQFAALTRVCGLLVPQYGEMPGAIETGAPAFLDFLISESPEDDQQIYTAGLDALNFQAALRFDKPFAEVAEAQAHELLAPLRRPWTPEPSSDPLTVFLQRAKDDVRTATVNTQLWAEAVASRGGSGRRMSGSGQYWLPLD
ncbi:MAG: gluconate 2-dehydrogenase subunit 3 family protein [Acidobacteria bacterium]|nr:gluconate 2-dehydrogenase subunit 3 family protein [Acidobacteriota bacterium]MDA1235782.1 gluconate 2-dehydrogenase subunit 3 family protein [Acidobacteriota bacterium]